MLTVIEAYSIPIIIALLIGLAAAFWALRNRQDKVLGDEPATRVEAPRPSPAAPPPGPAPAPPAPPLVQPQPTLGALPLPTEEIPLVTVPGTDALPDTLTTMKGVGPKFATRLNEEGITRFDQLASLSDADVAALDERMGAFRGRLVRDRVIEQASYLARDDRAGFEATFGKLGSA
jgi:predicted flap endonuclease-1-like 5' DNA nuclease